MIATVLRSLERFLLPNGCTACDRLVEDEAPDALLCGGCRARFQSLAASPRSCIRCAQPLPPVGPCRFCRDWTPALVRVSSAVWLNSEARAVVHHLKYDGRRSLAVLAAELMVEALPRPDCRWLIPIPVAPRRLRRRGFNQALLIARALAARWRVRVADRFLTRVRDRGSQTALTPGGRLANVAGAFAALAPPEGAGRRSRRAAASAVLLVDDVLTTGATLDAAARALDGAGWPTIGAATFARAMPYDLRVIARRPRGGVPPRNEPITPSRCG